MKIKLLLFSTLLLFSMAAYSQCDTTDTRFNELVKRYEAKYREMQPDTTKQDGPWSKTGLLSWAGDIDIRMVDKTISYDLVGVTMKNRKLSFNTPQVTMKEKKMSFTIVETVMETKTVGWKPEFRGPRVTMKPIKIDVPVVREKKVTMSTKIPEFKYATTSFITKVPEFKKERKSISLKLPQITIVTASSQAKALEHEAEKTQAAFETVSEQQKQEMVNLLTSTFECHKSNLFNQRQSVEAEFAAAISELDNSIRNVETQGLDPHNLKNEDGTTVNLIAVRNEVLAKEAETLKVFDTALEEILKREKEVIESV